MGEFRFWDNQGLAYLGLRWAWRYLIRRRLGLLTRFNIYYQSKTSEIIP